jgi:tRNA G10  N-methylase Trm11
MSMTTYAAFLGNHPSISTAELSATIPDFKSVRMIGASILIFESDMELGTKQLADWGGIFLLAKETKRVAKTLADIPDILQEETSNVKGKITFSLRAYGVQKSKVHDLYRDGKKILKKDGRAVRYIGNENKPAVSALLQDAGVLDAGKHGCELVLLGAENFLWVGRTVAAQDPDSYTKRDMHKPVRDTRVGLLPPKLAQIMLNFGAWIVRDMNPKAKKTLSVFDPFCGTGVIPMEALLRGWPVYASDMSLKAVNGCEKNIEWVRKEYGILKKDVPVVLWKQDATKEFELKDTPNMIVTETTLGPGLIERPTAKDAAKIRTECEATEIEFLENVAKHLPGVPVVAMFPVWFLKTGPLYLEKTWKKLEDIGFKAVLPKHIKTDNPERTSLLYRRPDQVVGREIVMLMPIKR